MTNRVRRALALICAIGLIGLLRIETSHAQQAATSTSPFTPVETPTLDPDALKTAPSAPNAKVRSNLDKPGDDQPKLKAPSVDLGKYELQFNAGHTSDINPRTGFDSGETSNISKIRPGQRSDSALPDYFGLKLTAPTR